MMKLSWNDELAIVAQRWADQCVVGHDKKQYKCDGTLVGQNVFATTGYLREGDDDGMIAMIDEALNGFYSEVEYFPSSNIGPYYK